MDDKLIYLIELRAKMFIKFILKSRCMRSGVANFLKLFIWVILFPPYLAKIST